MEKLKNYAILSLVIVCMLFTKPEKWFGGNDYNWMD